MLTMPSNCAGSSTYEGCGGGRGRRGGGRLLHRGGLVVCRGGALRHADVSNILSPIRE